MDIDECASTPCKNGAKCTDGPNKYTCECAEGKIKPLGFFGCKISLQISSIFTSFHPKENVHDLGL